MKSNIIILEEQEKPIKK